MTWAKHGSASVHFTIRQGLMCHWHLTRLAQLLHHAWAKSINLSYCVWIWGVVGSSSHLKRKKKKGANSHMQKRCVIQETRKTKHNLVSLHPVPERIWTARPTTLGLLLSSLMWPCASCVPGCAGSQLQHLPSTLPDGCWLCRSDGKLELRA